MNRFRLSKTRAKIAIWLLLLLLAVAGSLGGLWGLANLLAVFNTGADPAAALNIVPNRPPDWPVEVVWLPDDEPIGRPLEPITREAIEAAYVRSWLQMTLSLTKGEPYGLKSYFTLPAREMVEDALVEMGSSSWQYEKIATSHHLQVHFYAADGSVVAFTDYAGQVVELMRDENGIVRSVAQEAPTFQVVMLLEDSVWKVRHLVRQPPQPSPWYRQDPLHTPPHPLVTVDEGRLMLDGQQYALRAVNYYPQDTPWDLFWPAYDGKVINDDLKTIRQLGFNTVRIFVPYEQFGKDEVDLVLLAHLRDFFNTAYRHDVRVIVTLFDFRTDYRLFDWPKADRHLETLLTTFQAHPAILAWDLKNEPDLDFAANQAPLVEAWLAHTITLARRYDPHHLITIGWADGRSAHRLADQVDFLSFHFYRPVEELPGLINHLRENGVGRPLAVTEFGLPTWNSPFFPHGHTPAEQAHYLADVLQVIEREGLAGYGVWTLYDFAHVPGSVAGRYPWQKGPQKKLGLIDSSGRFKPAAALFAPGADLAGVLHPPAWARFLKPFWLTLFGTGIVFIWLAVTGLRTIRLQNLTSHGKPEDSD